MSTPLAGALAARTGPLSRCPCHGPARFFTVRVDASDARCRVVRFYQPAASPANSWLEVPLRALTGQTAAAAEVLARRYSAQAPPSPHQLGGWLRA